ncbi:MAG: AMP-binding protein, partial [Thermodesulfobacteriota bacterium]
GVMCPHHGIINRSFLSAQIQGMGPEDRTGLLVPLYHMFGNTCALLTGMTVGAALVIFGQYYETGQALRGLAEARCTIVYGAPSQFIAMMEHPLYREVDLSSLRGGIMGGAPCPMEVMRKVVDDMGVKAILVGYGQTEACSWVTLTRPDDALEVRVSTIGRALPRTEVKVVDPQTGEDTGVGRPGEMCARGFLMAGYYKMPAATAKALDAQGWLHTGDLVSMDEQGNCRVLGRIKELISSPDGGISPVEIEEVLFGHPDVIEAAAFGLPGRDGGERVAVWLKVRPGVRLEAEDVIAFCRERMPAGMVPEIVHLTDSFPMTATGKIQKFKMREITLAKIESGK